MAGRPEKGMKARVALGGLNPRFGGHQGARAGNRKVRHGQGIGWNQGAMGLVR